jgi:hypothetical protein
MESLVFVKKRREEKRTKEKKGKLGIKKATGSDIRGGVWVYFPGIINNNNRQRRRHKHQV